MPDDRFALGGHEQHWLTVIAGERRERCFKLAKGERRHENAIELSGQVAGRNGEHDAWLRRRRGCPARLGRRPRSRDNCTESQAINDAGRLVGDAGNGAAAHSAVEVGPEHELEARLREGNVNEVRRIAAELAARREGNVATASSRLVRSCSRRSTEMAAA